jgi:hypothetical protein
VVRILRTHVNQTPVLLDGGGGLTAIPECGGSGGIGRRLDSGRRGFGTRKLERDRLQKKQTRKHDTR